MKDEEPPAAEARRRERESQLVPVEKSLGEVEASVLFIRPHSAPADHLVGRRLGLPIQARGSNVVWLYPGISLARKAGVRVR
jgi:hypothetical protein